MKIEVRCPSCSKMGEIEISEDDIKNSRRGLLAINIRSGSFCDHTYIAYIDQNRKVRDCFLTDFEIQIPTIEQVFQEEKIDTDQEDLDVTLLKINLPISLIAYTIRGIIFRNPIKILFKQQYLFNLIENFFTYITKNNFEIDLKLITREDYIKNKKKFKEFLVLEGNNIVNDRNDIFKNRSLKVERTIASLFYHEIDPTSSLIIFKNELKKAYELSKSLIPFIKENERKEIQSKMLMDYLTVQKGINVELLYLEFLIDSVENYFGIKFNKASVLSDFLGSL
jgi:hypothetical protein